MPSPYPLQENSDYSFEFVTDQAVTYSVYFLDRHLARKRKFDNWFCRFNDGSLIKEDDLAVVEGVEIYNSMIIHKENPNLKDIILAFKELNMRADDK